MTVFSVFTVSAAALALLSSPAAATLGFDLVSNGRHWWGGWWAHRPANAETDDCVCMKGRSAKSGQLEGYCFGGLKFSDHTEEVFVVVPGGAWDHNQPVDITIYGDDGLWVDRFQLAYYGGKTYWGAHNTIGYCLSKNRNYQFDQYATHNGCYQTLSLNPDGNVYAYSSKAGYWKEPWLITRMDNTCKQLFGSDVTYDGGRIMYAAATTTNEPVGMGSSRRRRLGMMFPRPIEEPVAAPEDVPAGTRWLGPQDLDEDSLDDDPAGANPKAELERNVVAALHGMIKKMVKENDEVTDEQIDRLLDSAMLVVEQLQEKREGTEAVVEGDGSGSTTTNTSLEDRLGASRDKKRALKWWGPDNVGGEQKDKQDVEDEQLDQADSRRRAATEETSMPAPF